MNAVWKGKKGKRETAMEELGWNPLFQGWHRVRSAKFANFGQWWWDQRDPPHPKVPGTSAKSIPGPVYHASRQSSGRTERTFFDPGGTGYQTSGGRHGSTLQR